MLSYIRKLIRVNYQSVLLVIISFLLMILASYFYINDIVRSQILIIGEQTMDTAESTVNDILSNAELMFTTAYRDVLSMLSHDAPTTEILNYLDEINTFYTGSDSLVPDYVSGYGYINDEFLFRQQEELPADFDALTRPWYVGAKEKAGDAFFSSPYLDVVTNEMHWAYSRELITPEGTSFGVLSMDFSMARIIDYVTSEQMTDAGYGIFVDDRMRIISHNNPTFSGKALSDAHKGYGPVEAALRSQKTVSSLRFTDYNGVESVVFFRTILGNWHIGMVVPEDSYFESMNTMRISLGILGLLLMIALSYNLIIIRMQQLKAQEENKSKSTFLATMSHEMRTPLNAILGMSAIAASSKDEDKLTHCLNTITYSANHLLQMINGILDLSQTESRELVLNPAETSLSEMMAAVTSHIRTQADAKKQSFTLTIEKDVPGYFHTDQKRLEQVLEHLLNNAVKFSPEGGSISLHIRKISASRRKKSCLLGLEVTDNGIGISSKQKENLFRSFEQLDGRLSRKYEGTGMGLALSKNLVTLMGGEIGVRSEPDKGSQFFFTVPVRYPAATPSDSFVKEHKPVFTPSTISTVPSPPVTETADGSEAPEDDFPDFTGKHLLIVEDVELNREILIELLEDTGITTSCAENGREAYEMFQAHGTEYDMIFMDIHMPEMDGYEATKAIRGMAASKAANIPIVALTANVFQEDIMKCLDVGMNDHLGKPLEFDKVLAVMKKYLR